MSMSSSTELTKIKKYPKYFRYGFGSESAMRNSRKKASTTKMIPTNPATNMDVPTPAICLTTS